MSQNHQDALRFASILNQVDLHGKINIGKFSLSCKKGVSSSIQYNQVGLDMLSNQHEYTFEIQDGELQVSLQLYENTAGHYRLFCYTRIGNTQGMTFSVNLTTEKEGENIIYLTQKLKFVEQYKGSAQIAQSHRRQKQIVFCDLLKKLGLNVTESGDLVLGIFDPLKGKLVNTSIESLDLFPNSIFGYAGCRYDNR